MVSSKELEIIGGGLATPTKTIQETIHVMHLSGTHRANTRREPCVGKAKSSLINSVKNRQYLAT
jgi:hypothetical protein